MRGLDNTRAALPRVRKMGSNIVDGDVNVRADLIRLRRTKRTTLPADNDRTVAKRKLGMTHNAASACS